MTKTIFDALAILAPNSEWTIEGQNYDTIKWLSPNIPQPTKEAVEAELARLNAQEPIDECKRQAKKLLADTDWVLVSDAAASLANQADFIAYRAAVRALAINPVANPSFPAVPTAQWSS
jgi:hypothetical protein